jgi:hypothetical protein
MLENPEQKRENRSWPSGVIATFVILLGKRPSGKSAFKQYESLPTEGFGGF